ncbi:MAG TPA: GNAT family N-acetyltransferase [Spirochaetia bacterium]|nr:MAG: GNAT family N-acetyltransferase [Spirochaetes bacterium GWB1_36_13]HCL55526.1 GNAT family N-acetyltransferase [Spirochaetia bacterium]
MKIRFEKLSQEHGREVMEIFNHYIQYSFAAYPENPLPEEFFSKFMEITAGYPAFAIKNEEKIIGFCLLRPYNPFPVFRQTAEVSYFIHKDFTRHGIGEKALKQLEESAKSIGIRKLLADISSENPASIQFHLKNGFQECGKFSRTGKKFGKDFSVVWMEKDL